ncbi:MAG: tryptophan--tRNA ligase [Euryarchaeota archaeon]|nr:tryptophan--tRNA ligase [Euryarchaeota archaeon]
MRIDPWATARVADYDRLLKEFGIDRFDSSKLPNPQRLFRRGIVFGARGFDLIQGAIDARRSFAVLTGLMPSGPMHLGHKMVLDQAMYLHSVGGDLFVAVADIEAYATRGLSLEKAREVAIEEYIKSYIALGLPKKRCQVYFQSTRKAVKDLAYRAGRKVNFSTMKAIYGMDDQTNMAHMFAPLVQVGDILHVQLEEYGGPRPTVVPVGIDQDPHLRLTRDIAFGHRLTNAMAARDRRVGVFIKSDEDVEGLLGMAEGVASGLGFRKFKKIVKYKALYIEDAEAADVLALDAAMIREERSRNGLAFFTPSSTYHRFITLLTGDKMSSSKPDSAIFLSDPPGVAAQKILRAKTGGAVSVEEQRKTGGNPDGCSVFDMLMAHLVDDDWRLSEIKEDCRHGTRMCGPCKKEVAEMMQRFLGDLQERKAAAGETWKEFVVEDC